MSNRDTERKSAKMVKALSLYLGIATLLLSYFLRTALTLEGGSASAEFIRSYGSVLMLFVAVLHILAAYMFFSSVRERIDNRKEILLFIGADTDNPPTRSQRINAHFAGVSIPILMGLSFYAWITVMQIPEELIATRESSLLFNVLFLLQMYYINWEFSRFKLKRLNALNHEVDDQNPVENIVNER